MPKQDEAQRRKELYVAMALLLFSIAAIVSFFANFLPLFYVAVLVSIILGFYLTRNLSKGAVEEEPGTRKQNR